MNTIEGKTRTTLLKMWKGQPLNPVEIRSVIDHVELLIQQNNKLKNNEHSREAFKAGYISAMFTVNCFMKINYNSDLKIDYSPHYIQDSYREWVDK